MGTLIPAIVHFFPSEHCGQIEALVMKQKDCLNGDQSKRERERELGQVLISNLTATLGNKTFVMACVESNSCKQ